MANDNKHVWQYYSLGGVIRVKIDSGEDIAHLDELDEKYWTVLSCPVDGLAMDKQTLSYLDLDGDGKIRISEVTKTAKWLSSCIRDKDLLLKGNSSLPLSEFDTDTPEGLRLYNSAKSILANLHSEKEEISIEDASAETSIFSGTKFNGDGIITLVSAGDDEELKATIRECMDKIGSVTDRSGDPGVNAGMIEQFYSACADYSAWQAEAESNRDTVLPFGEQTQAGYEAYLALKDKINDFYLRCRLLRFDPETAASVDVAINKIEDLVNRPIAKPGKDAKLNLNGINPSWQAAVDKLIAVIPAKEIPADHELREEEWNSIAARFESYAAWLGAKKGEVVEGLGTDRINAILKAGRKQDLLDLVAADSALKEESESIDDVKKLMYLYRDFSSFLRNYVIFSDFYARKDGTRAMFEAGRLFIDQRCCNLCIKVSDMSKHEDMAKLSGMFLIYCNCVSKTHGDTMDIVAVLTAGEISDLRPGKNGIFYDRNGGDWDATITRIVDNPISIANAFWAPYRKFWEFCVGILDKSVSEREEKISTEMQNKVLEATSSTEKTSDSKQGFDIAKFAGIFAALGMAIGYIGSFLTKLVTGIAQTPLWQLLLGIIAIMLIISGPSCISAMSKLRKRNLGPVLNANGWAINSKVLVNILFGNQLTSVVKYPKLNISDPYKQDTPAWKKWLTAFITILIIAAVVCYFVFLQ